MKNAPKSIIVVCLAVLTAGCSSIGYYTQAARGHMNMMSQRVEVAKLLEAQDVDTTLKARLELAQQARDFAISHLALPDNKSYRSYADLERRYVLWNVFATEEFSVAPKTWCYWFVGCLAYRGYFAEPKADAVAADLRTQGYDVLVGGVPAYSTLGRFADPLLNTMFYRQDVYVVELIFHELTHQAVYRAGDSEFSESLASFVQQEGVTRWLTARDDHMGLEAYQLAQVREKQFVELLISTREKLAELFEQDIAVKLMRDKKQAVFSDMKAQYQDLKTTWGGYDGYDNWFARDINNAHLVAISTYHRLIPAFALLLDQSAGDMATFFERAGELAELDNDVLAERLDEMLQD